MVKYVIAVPGDHPPFVTTPPSSYKGALWDYWPATKEWAQKALKLHAEEWSDYPEDELLLKLAHEGLENERG